MRTSPTFGIRADLRHDEEMCEGCLKLLADTADLRRVETRGRVDLLAICRCGEATVIPWASDRWVA